MRKKNVLCPPTSRYAPTVKKMELKPVFYKCALQGEQVVSLHLCFYRCKETTFHPVGLILVKIITKRFSTSL